MKAFAVVLAALAALAVAEWTPPLLHLSDLPSYHFSQHFGSDVPHARPTPVGNGTALVPHSKCSHYDSCIMCSDNRACSWCAAPGPAPGHCVLTHEVQAQCLALGGSTGECPFFTTSLFVTTGLLAVLIMLAAGGGIGGGALFIPVLLLVYGLSAHQAVPLSKVTIFGLAIGSYSVLYFKRHPLKDAPLIDYDFAMLLVPGILLGTIAGVYLNVIFPAFLIGIALSMLVSITSVRTWRKGFKMAAKERHDDRDEESTEVVEMDSLGKSGASQPLLMNDALQPILEREAAVPLRKFAVFGITWGGLVLLVLLKGGGSGTSLVGIECGSPAFFVVLFAAAPFLLGIAFLVGRRLLREHQEKCVAGYSFGEYDLQFDARSVIIIPLLGMCAGLAAGFLGIGAGLVVGPIMLELGSMPEVTQATASFTILFTASSTSLQFILLGKLPIRAAFWFFALGFLMSIVGQNGVSYLLRKFKKQSVMVFFLATMITLSAVFMTANSVYRIAKDGFAGSFHNPCGESIE